MEKKIIEFEGGGFLKLEKFDDIVEIIFQAPYMEDKFRITSMNAQLTVTDAIELGKWLVEVVNE